MATQNGVYETSTGDLLRVGIGVDFVNDGSFDSTNETIRTDVPIPGKVRGDTNYTNMHRWNGSAWVEVTQALVPIVSDFISDMSIGGWNPSPNLIGHWQLGDRTNTTAVLDSSPNKYAGVMIGGNTEDINTDSLITGGKSAHDFDGSTHAHNIDAAIASGNLPNAKKGTLCCVISPDVVATDALRFFSFGDADAVTEIGLMQGAVNGTVKAWCRIAGTMQWEVETNSVVISNGTTTWIVLSHNETAPVFFIGDVANGMRKIASTFSVSLNKTKWFNDAPGLDSGRIGCKFVNGNTGKFFNGKLQDCRVYDTNWSLNDAIGWFNNGKGTLAESGMVSWKQAEALTFLGVEASADVTDLTNVNAAGAVMETDYDAATFLYAVSNNTPVKKTPTEVLAILSGQATAAFDLNSQNLTGIVDIALSGDIDFSGAGDITASGDLTLAPTSDVVIPSASLKFDNAEGIRFKDTGGTSRLAMRLDSSDVLVLVNNAGGSGGHISFNSLSGGAEAVRITVTGNLLIGRTGARGRLDIDQSSTTAALPVAVFDQADISEEMFEFVSTIGTGNAIEAVGAKTLTTTHFVKVTLPGGLTRYIPVGTIA